MTNYLDWNWSGEHVQAEVQNGEYLSSESTLLLAGPSRFTHLNSAGGLSTNALIPLGLIQNISIAQSRTVNRLYEIGSKRAYFVPGRLFANFQMGRVMFYGPSLLRMLYALAPLSTVNGGPLGPFGQPLNQDPDDPAREGVSIPSAYQSLFQTTPLQNAPGYGGTGDEQNRDFYINLASELFNVPFGLILVFKDTRNRPFGAAYLEDCFIETYNLGLDANSVVISEAVSGQFDSVAPIQLVTT
jgi:hypothetical protein